ncbi:PadR family transcriptional regulator [Stackebrandtia nassauensis]|uniref:Transcriptional regulator, PadR-like family n=1 Tax=Stackebrandtia nassauensis (strain DSM 44728 / CIP 108903 / NRRL B-16338 / NBRC 102104 / LLR-40K-21) TaxID=446470 RepID=D3Q0R6_STANL|nr:PadR family transcriptional regulator [Stackebrandtia nassauensis]ADD41802.1 transcriptional regulator, PadR-like family [Stackebrandtia nassauensis DSM 44728]
MSREHSWNNPWGADMRETLRGMRRSHAEGDSSHGRGRGRGRGRHHSHHRGYGPPGMGGPWGGMPPMPPMPPFPPGFGGGRGFGHRGRKARRGDVRAAILSLLGEGPMNGYQVMQAIAERSQGGWRPSPGAVYPALQQLTDEGLVQPTGEGRKTLFELTEAGTAYIAEHADEVEAPWEAMTPQIDDDVVELMNLAQQSGTALMQVIQSAGPVGRAKARKLLEDGRRGLYQILAEGEPEPEAADDADEEPTQD